MPFVIVIDRDEQRQPVIIWEKAICQIPPALASWMQIAVKIAKCFGDLVKLAERQPAIALRLDVRRPVSFRCWSLHCAIPPHSGGSALIRDSRKTVRGTVYRPLLPCGKRCL